MDTDTRTLEEKQEAFLSVLAQYGSIRRACLAAKVKPWDVFSWREKDATFAAAWKAAEEIGSTWLEDVAHKRATEGDPKPLYYQGNPVYQRRAVIDENGQEAFELVRDEEGQPIQAVEYQRSDGLLTLLLKANNRRKFGDKQEITGADGGPLQVEATETERARRVAFLLARGLAAVGNEHEPQLIEHQPIEHQPIDDEDLI